MSKNQALVLLIIILLAAFFLRQYRLLDLPFFGDEVDEGDIALDILHGNLAPFYPESDGHEALYNYSMALAFATLGDSEIANRWPSVAWSTIFVAIMYVYAQRLFKSRRVGVMAAGLAAALWWPTVFAHVGLRPIVLPVVMAPALLGLAQILRANSSISAQRAAVVGGAFAGLTAYTYTAGRGFPVIVILFLIYAVLTQRALLQKRARECATYFLLMIIASAWLYAYLYVHPDQDVRINTMSFGLDLIASGNFPALSRAVADTVGMFTVRGEQNWLWNISGRPVFPGVEGLVFYLGVLLCLARWRRPEYGLQLILLATMMVPSILTEHPPNWTRSIGMLPALIAITVLPIEWGWQRIENFSRTRFVYASFVLLLGISIYSRTAFDMFDVWIDHPGVYWMTLAYYDSAGKYINRSVDSTPVNYVMDVYTDWRKHNVQRVAQRSDVQMRWSVKNAFVFPKDSRGTRIAFQIFGDPALPLQFTFLDLDRPIYIDPRADPEGNRPLRIYYVPRARLDEHLSRAKTNPVFLPDSNTRIDSFQVGEISQFLGYELLNPNARDELDMLTYWRVLRPPQEMVIFLHLLDSNGNVISQYDGFDVVSEDLKPDDVVVQLHALKLPGNLRNAPYRFEIGAYTRADLHRLPLSPGGDHLWLQTWTPQQ